MCKCSLYASVVYTKLCSMYCNIIINVGILYLLSTEEVVVGRVTAGPMDEGTGICADTIQIQTTKITSRAELVAIVYNYIK